MAAAETAGKAIREDDVSRTSLAGAFAVVATALRASQLPDVPTFNELGVAYGDDTSWYALFAPKGTPKDIIARINADTAQMLTTPDMKKRADQLGFRLVGGLPEKLGDYLRSEVTKWADVARHAALVPN
jgi:tripartite-type tricarboxylate transporter receptor subunit TctC